MKTKKAGELVACQHIYQDDSAPYYVIYAGETRNFVICKACYALIYRDIVKSVLKSLIDKKK